jgi:hypothetical protein
MRSELLGNKHIGKCGPFDGGLQRQVRVLRAGRGDEVGRVVRGRQLGGWGTMMTNVQLMCASRNGGNKGNGVFMYQQASVLLFVCATTNRCCD